MVAPKKLGRRGDINKKLQVKSALASTEHSLLCQLASDDSENIITLLYLTNVLESY